MHYSGPIRIAKDSAHNLLGAGVLGGGRGGRLEEAEKLVSTLVCFVQRSFCNGLDHQTFQLQPDTEYRQKSEFEPKITHK